METERTKETKPGPHPVDISEEWKRAKSNVVVNMIGKSGFRWLLSPFWEAGFFSLYWFLQL